MKIFLKNSFHFSSRRILFLASIISAINTTLCQVMDLHSEQVNLGLDRVNGKKSFLLGGFNINPYDPIARVAGGFWSKIFKPVFGKTVHQNPNQNYNTNNNIVSKKMTPSTSVPLTTTTTTSVPLKVTQGAEFTTMPPTVIPKATLPPMKVTSTIQPLTNPSTRPTTPKTLKPIVTVPSTLPHISVKPSSAKPTPIPVSFSPVTVKVSTSPEPTKVSYSPSQPSTKLTTTRPSSLTSENPSPHQPQVTTPTALLSSSSSPVTPSPDDLINCIDWLIEWLQNNNTIPLRSKGYHKDRA